MGLTRVFNKTNPEYFPVHYVAIVAAMLSLALGSTVLVGWHFHNLSLIHVTAALPPMQYNTALGFTLAGAALLALIHAYKRVTLFLASAILIIGLLTLFEYVFGVNLYIDQLLMEDYILVESLHPGRMAPNTALCFSLAGISLLIGSLRHDYDLSLAWIGVMGSIIIALGIVAMTGYLVGIEAAYGWGKLTRMAIHTATGFITLGAGLGAYAWLHKGKRKKVRIPYWLPLSAGVGSITFTLLLWQALHAAESKYIAVLGPGAVLHADNAVLIFGALFTVALVLSVRFAEIAQERLYNVLRSQKELQKFSLAVEHNPTSILITDAEGEIEYINPKYCKLSGYSEQEIIGQNPRLLKSGEQPLEFYQKLWKTINSGEEWSGEVHNRKKNGELFWVKASISPIMNEEGVITSFVGIQEDITERKLAAEALRESEHNLVAGQKIAKMGNWKLYPETGEVECSDELLKIFGITRNHLNLNAFVNVVHPEDLEHNLEHIQKGINQGIAWDIEHRLLMKDGTVKWLHAVGEPELDDEGKTDYIIGFVQDITERKRAEIERERADNRLRESEERFALAMRGANDGLWDWDLETDEVYFSPRWKSMLGYEESELDTHLSTWEKLIHPDDKDRSMKKVQDCLDGHSDSLAVEIRMRHKQGEWINILSRGFLVRRPRDNKPLRFVGTHTDITEHKVMMGELQLLTENRKLSQQLLQVQENERNSLARDLHDNLGQSLSAISSITALISTRTKSKGIADNAAEIGMIVDSIFETVRGMLSRMRPHMLDLLGLCPAIEDLFEYSCKGSGTTCSLTASEDFPDLPDAVSVAVYRAVQEACTNAVRHADASRFEVELHMVEQKKESGIIEKEVKLNIRDDGKGVDLSESDSFGLGLIGMRERIMSLDGECRFNTAPGEGMHITISIPLEDDPHEE